jgi:hypothetical protein
MFIALPCPTVMSSPTNSTRIRASSATSTVAHGFKEWACDDDDDDVFEVYTNSTEGLWTDLRNFLRPIRGVSKHFLSGYVAIHEFRVNLQHISPAFISDLVAVHSFLT